MTSKSCIARKIFVFRAGAWCKREKCSWKAIFSERYFLKKLAIVVSIIQPIEHELRDSEMQPIARAAARYLPGLLPPASALDPSKLYMFVDNISSHSLIIVDLIKYSEVITYILEFCDHLTILWSKKGSKTLNL